MNTDVTIIPCDFENKDHGEALVNLMNEYITDKMGGGDPYTPGQKIKLVEGLKNHPTSHTWFALSNGQFIGLITVFVNFATFTVKPFINIHDVIVTQAWRDKGIGRKMLEQVIEKAGELGCSKVTLEVRSDNENAMHLYNNLGFHDQEPRQYYWAKYL
jgi:ribosomal protein S18 acetylase RimI-like enzyme